ncbi:MAG: biosynthetic-type acetolactate synthase large subunit, partial [Planctomycetes bacterium]|nr:biosynthetic-type acetolactate synthase large subunit [Planctomycetota bacterium]
MTNKFASGGEALIRCLEREGVTHIFGYQGGAAMPIFDALLDSKIHLVDVRHEQGACHMADGYARSTGRPGVVLVTSGPGATNTITGLLTSMMDSVPVIVITGQTITSQLGKDAFQEADVTGLTYAVTKHSYLIKDPEEIPRVVKESFYIATTGRPGPVLIDFPKDISQGPCNASYIDSIELPGYDVPNRAENVDLEEAARLINAAKKPLLYVGHGAVISGAGEAIMRFAEKIKSPLVNTLLGKGACPEDHELNLGMLGMHGTAYANKAVVDCDLIFAIGARWDDRITGKLDEFCKDAKKIHLDIDRAEFGKIIDPDVCLAGDARMVIEDLIPMCHELETQAWLKQCQAWRKKFPLKYSKQGGLRAQYVIDRLDKLGGRDCIITTDVGQHQMWAAQFSLTTQNRHFLSSGGAGTMGFGFPAAIGATMATGKPSWAIVGDGGFQM